MEKALGVGSRGYVPPAPPAPPLAGGGGWVVSAGALRALPPELSALHIPPSLLHCVCLPALGRCRPSRAASHALRHLRAASRVAPRRQPTPNPAQPPTLPLSRRIYTVLRSPHVNKDSREQFETRTHSRLVYISDPTAETVDGLMKLQLPAGVDVEVKV